MALHKNSGGHKVRIHPQAVISVSNLIHPIFVVEEMSEDHQNQYVSSYGDHGSQFKMEAMKALLSYFNRDQSGADRSTSCYRANNKHYQSNTESDLASNRK